MKEQLTKMIQAAVDGEASCCEVHAELKAIETIIKSGIKLIKSGAVEEAREFDKGERYYGGTWQIRSSATLLHYEDDEPYKEYSELASDRKKLLNSAWKAKNEGIGFYTDDGEEIPILKVKTPGTETAIFKATPSKEDSSVKSTKWTFNEGRKMIFD